jgi:hypothetical protein
MPCLALPEDLTFQLGSYLTPSKRNKIIGISLARITPKDISSVTKIPLQTIRNTIILNPKRSKGFGFFGRGMKQTYNATFYVS